MATQYCQSLIIELNLIKPWLATIIDLFLPCDVYRFLNVFIPDVTLKDCACAHHWSILTDTANEKNPMDQLRKGLTLA